MPHTRQTVSFNVTLVLQEDFLTGVFGELEIPEKSPLNFTGGETSFKFFTLLMQLAPKCKNFKI